MLMALFAHFEKRSEKFGLFFKLQLKIQTVFGLKTFGMLITFHSDFFQTVFRPFFHVARKLFDTRGKARIKSDFFLQTMEIEN